MDQTTRPSMFKFLKKLSISNWYLSQLISATVIWTQNIDIDFSAVIGCQLK